MPRGAAVIPYDGKRGRVWRIKYGDSTGKQVMETIGAERDGVTRKQAEAELRDRLVKVERKGLAQAGPTHLQRPTLKIGSLLASRAAGGSRTRLSCTAPSTGGSSTRSGRCGSPRSGRGTSPPSRIAQNGRRSIVDHRDLSVLHAIFKTALREELVDANPAEAAERPKAIRRRWRILEPAEVARVAKAFTDDQARTVFLTLILTGVRRFELQELRWRDVDLLDGVLRVRRSKSEAGERSIALSPTLRDVLSDRYRRTAYNGDDDRVFCHPDRGSVYRAEGFREALRAALERRSVKDRPPAFPRPQACGLTNGAAAGESPVALMTQGRPHEHGDHEAVPAPRRHRVPRRGRAAR